MQVYIDVSFKGIEVLLVQSFWQEECFDTSCPRKKFPLNMSPSLFLINTPLGAKIYIHISHILCPRGGPLSIPSPVQDEAATSECQESGRRADSTVLRKRNCLDFQFKEVAALVECSERPDAFWSDSFICCFDIENSLSPWDCNTVQVHISRVDLGFPNPRSLSRPRVPTCPARWGLGLAFPSWQCGLNPGYCSQLLLTCDDEPAGCLRSTTEKSQKIPCDFPSPPFLIKKDAHRALSSVYLPII